MKKLTSGEKLEKSELLKLLEEIDKKKIPRGLILEYGDEPRGVKKLLNIFDKYIKTEYFHLEVLRIRNFLDIKDIELKIEEKAENVVSSDPEDDDKPLLFLSLCRHGHFKNFCAACKKSIVKTFFEETEKIIENSPSKNIYFKLLIYYYILFDKFFYKELEKQIYYLYLNNVCCIDDANSEIERYYLPDEQEYNISIKDIEDHNDTLYKYSLEYPIVLRIDKSAGQKDVIDFIKTNWKQIESIQSEYNDNKEFERISIKNSKVTKNSNIKERNDFIWECYKSGLKSKEIVAEVMKKYSNYQEINKDYYNKHYCMDYGAIGKVISKYKKEKKS